MGTHAEQSFQTIKDIIAKDVVLCYPYYNLPFNVYRDSSDLQLGEIIIQDGVPVAFYSRKLNPAQNNYSTLEKELLFIKEILKDFHSMLFG